MASGFTRTNHGLIGLKAEREGRKDLVAIRVEGRVFVLAELRPPWLRRENIERLTSAASTEE